MAGGSTSSWQPGQPIVTFTFVKPTMSSVGEPDR
jgi:hypothetical protein